MSIFKKSPAEKREKIYQKLMKFKNDKNSWTPSSIALELHDLGDPRGIDYLVSSLDDSYDILVRANAAILLYVIANDIRGLYWILDILANWENIGDRKAEWSGSNLHFMLKKYRYAPLIKALTEPNPKIRNDVVKYIKDMADRFYRGYLNPQEIELRKFLLSLIPSETDSKHEARGDTPYFQKQQYNRNQAENFFSKGAAFAQQQKWSEAIEALIEAIRLDPDHAKAHMCLTLCYGSVMNFDAARAHYEILKKLDPGLASALANSPAGILLLRSGGLIKS
jgi:tetratricopeptide (TPR) repeat protein